MKRISTQCPAPAPCDKSSRAIQSSAQRSRRGRVPSDWVESPGPGSWGMGKGSGDATPPRPLPAPRPRRTARAPRPLRTTRGGTLSTGPMGRAFWANVIWCDAFYLFGCTERIFGLEMFFFFFSSCVLTDISTHPHRRFYRHMPLECFLSGTWATARTFASSSRSVRRFFKWFLCRPQIIRKSFHIHVA